MKSVENVGLADYVDALSQVILSSAPVDGSYDNPEFRKGLEYAHRLAVHTAERVHAERLSSSTLTQGVQDAY